MQKYEMFQNVKHSIILYHLLRHLVTSDSKVSVSQVDVSTWSLSFAKKFLKICSL